MHSLRPLKNKMRLTDNQATKQTCRPVSEESKTRMSRPQTNEQLTLSQAYATFAYGTNAQTAETVALVESYYDRPWIMSESAYRRASAAVERVPRSCFERSYVTEVLGLDAPLLEGGDWPRDFEKRIIQEQLLMEGFFGDLLDSAKEKLMSAAEGIKKFGEEAWSVLKGFYLAVTEGKAASLAKELFKLAIKPIMTPLKGALEWLASKLPGFGMDKLASIAQKGLDLINKIKDKLGGVKGWKAVTLFSGVAIGLQWLWNEIGDWIEELLSKVGGSFTAAMNEQDDDAGAKEGLVNWLKESGKEMLSKIIGPELMKKISKLAAEVTVSGWWKAAKAVGKGAKLVVDAIGAATERFVSRDETRKRVAKDITGESVERGSKVKITKRQLANIIKEAQFGRFTGGAAPLDVPMRDSGPVPKDQLRKLADIFINDMGMSPEEVLSKPEFAEQGITDLKQIEESKMKITKRQLRRIIKEEKAKLIKEQRSPELTLPETQAVMSALQQLLNVVQEKAGSHRPDSARLNRYAVEMVEEIIRVAETNLYGVEGYMPPTGN